MFPKAIILLTFILTLFAGCKKSDTEIEYIELIRAGGIVVNDNNDLIANIMEGLQTIDDKSLVYGIDFRTKLPFELSLKSGSVRF